MLGSQELCVGTALRNLAKGAESRFFAMVTRRFGLQRVSPAKHAARTIYLRTEFLFLVFSLAPLTLVALGQSTAGLIASSADARATPDVGTRDQMAVDIVARSKNNRPVTDLNLRDIVVSDAGKPAQLTDLRLVTPASGSAPMVTMVFDSMTPAPARAAQRIAAQIISLLPPQSSFAVFSVKGRLRLFQDFTTDRTALLTATSATNAAGAQADFSAAEKRFLALANPGVDKSAATASGEERARAQALVSILMKAQQSARELHTSPAIAGLLTLADAQKKLPGRRVILFFSEALGANPKSEAGVQQVIDAANLAGVPIYTIDTSALGAKGSSEEVAFFTAPSAGIHGGTPFLSMGPVGVYAPAKDADTPGAHGGSLAALANGTGGFRINAAGNADKLTKPLEQLIADISAYYEATYTPALKDNDSQLHPIQISSRRSGVAIADAPIVQPFEVPLLKILDGPTLPSDVAFHQAVLRWGGDFSESSNELAIEVPISLLNVHKDESASLYSAHVTILAQIKDKSGAVLEHFSEDIARRGDLKQIDSFLADRLTLQRPFVAPPGDYVLEAAVTDLNGGKSGAQRAEFTIPDAGDGPRLSDVALVLRTAALDGSPEPSETMVYNKTRVVPNLSRHVRAEASRISFFFCLRQGARTAGSEFTLEMDVQRNGLPVAHSSNTILGAAAKDSVHFATMESKSFLPGEYRAVFTLRQGDRTASRAIDFTVVGSQPEADARQPDVTSSDASEALVLSSDPGHEADALTAAFEEQNSTRFSASTNQAAPPTQSYLEAMLDRARERVLAFTNSLMNFRCTEVTDRFVDAKGDGKWVHRDTITEALEYEDHEEHRATVNLVEHSGDDHERGLINARMAGEFGPALKIIFAPSSHTEFQWKETDTYNGGTVQVFSYRVDPKSDAYTLRLSGTNLAKVGQHGLLYIDDATRDVRRVTSIADAIPHNFAIRASAVALDYDYVSINNHDYFVPVHEEFRLKFGTHTGVLQLIQFKEYRRFASQIKVISDAP
jgi:VWFA-related protein